VLLVSEPVLGEEEKRALCAVISSNWITMGSRVRAFEEAFAAAHGANDGVAVNSCTAGLHLALAALGIGPGDEVLVPSLSFVATANAVIYCGAAPVFVDIESLDMPLMSVLDAAARCTARTKAVIVMHYGGYVANADVWRAFAAARGLYLLEDSAHAVGSARGPVFGDFAVFSFFGNKNMTTAEGGMILGGDQAQLDRMRLGRGHGMTTSTVQRLNGQGTYDVAMLGFNYRMTELNAALGMVQLARLPEWNLRRQALSRRYRTLLLDSGVDMPYAHHEISSHHICPVLLPVVANRQQVVSGLRELEIQTSFHYPPIHLLSWYRERTPELRLPLTELFAQRELTLPLHPKMEDSQVGYVVESLKRVLASSAEART
jgi:dTDP-4-amino-4,6-dideoxygalactose transaminase